MAIDQKNSSAKGLFSSLDIKTMRKDLKRLREADVVKESKKIAEFQAPVKQAAPVLVVKNPEILPRETEAMEKAKQYATEEEKQAIFSLESQKADTKSHMSTVNKDEESRLALEKNGILIARENFQKQLNPLAVEEEKFEQEQDNLESAIAGATVPEEKQKLEKSRWDVEARREAVQKKRWAVEKELDAQNQKLAAVEEEYKHLRQGEDSQKEKIAKVNNSLRQIYTTAIEREKAEAKVQDQQKEQAKSDEVLQKARLEKQEKINSLKAAQENQTGQVSQAAAEKFQASVKTEESQRAKFMEDIEKWASSNKK